MIWRLSDFQLSGATRLSNFSQTGSDSNCVMVVPLYSFAIRSLNRHWDHFIPGGGTVKHVFGGLLVFVLACTAAWSQSTAQINGVVKDQSGAILPGVDVSATQTATGAKRSAVTNENGGFVLPNLPVGPYMLEAS